MVISFPGFGFGFGPSRRSGTSEDGGAGAAALAALAEVRAYWEALRSGARPGAVGRSGLPLRRAIDPRGIEGALDAAFMLERVAPGMARLRLAGMTLVDMMGMEVRGMPVSALFEPIARARLAPALEQVFQDHMALTLTLEAERGIGRPALSAQMLILPLEDDRGASTLALGVLGMTGSIGRSPRRFAIAGLRTEAPVPPAAPVVAPALPQAMGFADPGADFRPHRVRPHLRLVKSDRK